ncbi:hypothetical protein Tco_1413526 [Tanacetum coccineum]
MESVVQMMLVSPIISSSSHNKSSSCHFNNSLSYNNNNSNKSYPSSHSLFSLSTTPSKGNLWATSQRVKEIRASAGLEQLGEELAKLETATASDSFWDDRTSAQQTLLALTDVKDKLNLLKEFQSQVLTSFILTGVVYSAKACFYLCFVWTWLSLDDLKLYLVRESLEYALTNITIWGSLNAE